MLRCKKRSARLFKFLVFVILVAGLAYGCYEYRTFTAVPTTRLAAGSYYPEMPLTAITIIYNCLLITMILPREISRTSTS
jgi:hypothetical protein